MAAETELQALLKNMQPVLDGREFVFCTIPVGDIPEGLPTVCTCHEAEGLTLVVERLQAEAHGLLGSYPCRMLTLNVHSALEAVGFLAAVLAALAAHGISANAVAGFYHDHLFVPVARAEKAVAVLQEMMREA